MQQQQSERRSRLRLCFHAKIVGSNWLVSFGSVDVNEVIKVGRLQKTQVLRQAVFLAGSQLALGGSAAKKLYFLRAKNTVSYAG